MADELTIKFEGTEELSKKLDAIGGIIKDSHEGIIAQAAYAIERQAKKNASGRPGPRVGQDRLRSSITTDIKSYDEAVVGTNLFYAPYVEFGHKQHPGQFVPPLGLRLVADFCPAYPYLYPAVDQCRDELEGIFVTFSHDIETEFGK